MKDHPCAHHLPTPSAPTPGEDWEESLRIQIIGNRLPSDKWDETKSFIRNLLSSHASKAREEGRKEGAGETWARAVEIVERKRGVFICPSDKEQELRWFGNGIKCAINALREEAGKEGVEV